MFGGQFMRAIDRVRAEKQLVEELSKEMNWQDVSTLFKRLRIQGPPADADIGFNDYIRGCLAGCSDEVLLDIANQLDLDVERGEVSNVARQPAESKYWLVDHFRVFISHVHTSKAQAGALRAALRVYSISCFVAHDDIEPSGEWREEILRSLRSMDAFVAIITPDFNSSKWTDQEVGIAVGRDVVIVPINRGENPYGFMAKYQALQSVGLLPNQVADAVFRVLATNPRSRARVVECLTRAISTGASAEVAKFQMYQLSRIAGVSDDNWRGIRENVASNAILRLSQEMLDYLNPILTSKGITPVGASDSDAQPLNDEIPF